MEFVTTPLCPTHIGWNVCWVVSSATQPNLHGNMGAIYSTTLLLYYAEPRVPVMNGVKKLIVCHNDYNVFYD